MTIAIKFNKVELYDLEYALERAIAHYGNAIAKAGGSCEYLSRTIDQYISLRTKIQTHLVALDETSQTTQGMEK